MDPRTHADSLEVAASPEEVYDLVSDVTRTGEWSQQCRACEWADGAEPGRVGARFVGHNETPVRQWTTTSEVVVADRPREFAWEVGPGLVRWGYEMRAVEGGTLLTHTWHFLDGGLAFFADKYGDDAEREVEIRTTAAHEGIPATLSTLKDLLER